MSSTKEREVLEDVIIRFAGDSGDGMQLTGMQFTHTAALFGNDISTFPDFPAEIRAPQGTLAGVSGFQLHFGSVEIHTPGDKCDVLVVMNAAALKANIRQLNIGGTIIVNTDGFDPKNLRLAGYPDGAAPLEDPALNDFKLHKIDVTKITRAALTDSGLSTKETDRSKNMFVLGFVYWLYDRKMDHTILSLQEKFAKKPEILEANLRVLRAGYNYGETTEAFHTQYEVKPAKQDPGTYRSITGNEAAALGLIAAAKKAGLELFYGTYPITPASDILHELSKHKNFGVKTFQAEDEIAAICSAIGASFGGALGVTASSGPGIALKTEAIGLAMMLELPLVIIDVQRGGPSTGLPTKTEQSDLLQAYYGRNGEAPIPVIAAYSASDCFDSLYEACRIAIEHMTPVMFLSDGYLANGSEPWAFPQAAQLKEIKVEFAKAREQADPNFLPYLRDEKLSRPWAIPGTKGLEHRIGGLEKQHETGNISYDHDNHQFMVNLRAEKIERIADYIPLQTIDNGPEKGQVLVLGWGSTYGAIKIATQKVLAMGYNVAHAHLKHMRPFPKNLGEILKNYDHVLIPEMNSGQLVKIIRDKYLVDAIGFSKVKGLPFTAGEVRTRILEMLEK